MMVLDDSDEDKLEWAQGNPIHNICEMEDGKEESNATFKSAGRRRLGDSASTAAALNRHGVETVATTVGVSTPC